jgi:putative phosphoribosyl transferase
MAARIAEELRCPWDMVVVQKLAFPWNPELGFGAVALDGTMVQKHRLVDRTRFTPAEVEHVKRGVLREAERRERIYRGGRPFPRVAGCSVILTDDGLASGYTMLAAVEFVKKAGPLRVVVASPVASGSAVSAVGLLRPAVDRLVTLHVSDAWSFAVGSFYYTFSQVTDGEVLMAVNAGDAASPPASGYSSRAAETGQAGGGMPRRSGVGGSGGWLAGGVK